MTGFSKITDKILAEAKKDAEAAIAAAEARAAEILAEAEARAEALAREIDEDSRQRAEEIVARAHADEAMIRRSAALAARAHMVDEAFELARREILNLSTERYVEFLSMLLTSAMREQLADEEKSLAIYGEAESAPEDFVILLNERDRDRIGNALTEKLQTKKTAGELAYLPKIAEEHANIDGGLILRRGKIEINCSVGALFGELRPEYEGRVVARLFAEKKG